MEQQFAFQINHNDNVATALTALQPGYVRISGDAVDSQVQCIEPVPIGHKIALTRIEEGAAIVKYGISIGYATREIPQGSWVHLHCMRSGYDERSSHLDIYTGAPNDTRYE